VIDVPNRPDIQVRLVSLEFFLRHCSVSSSACSLARAFVEMELELFF